MRGLYELCCQGHHARGPCRYRRHRARDLRAGAGHLGSRRHLPYPVYARWALAYQQETGTKINYQAIGSGGGIRQIKERTVTFGASDSPLKPDDLAKAGLVQFPLIMGGVVPVVNIVGIKPGQLHLDGPTMARIYLGEIENWDDPAIKALNPDLPLPSWRSHRSTGLTVRARTSCSRII